jgi:hypothetical protein
MHNAPYELIRLLFVYYGIQLVRIQSLEHFLHSQCDLRIKVSPFLGIGRDLIAREESTTLEDPE